jgi:hypothetical protein
MGKFLGAVRSGRAEPSQIETGMAVTRAIAAAEESILAGQTVMLR